MRCFVAIPLPEQVEKQLSDLREPIKNIRWQSKEQLHITLKFLGDVSNDKVRELQSELKTIEGAPFSISLKGFGCFSNRGKPRALWAGVEKNESLQRLRDKVENLCVSAGFEVEKRPFRPHITLARMKRVSKREIDSFISNHPNFEIRDIPVDDFVLYESRLHPEGAEYIKLKCFELEKD